MIRAGVQEVRMSLEQHDETLSQDETRAATKAYAFVYSAGPKWIAGLPVTKQNLGAHRAYIEKLLEQGQLICGGPFLDNEGGGLAIVRAGSRQEASALLA